MATVQFVGGDELIQPFLLEQSSGAILNLTDLAISGAVRWRGKTRLTLDVDEEIELETLNPSRAADPEDQTPHGFLHLTELQTAAFPLGANAKLRLTVIDAGVTMSTFDYVMERVG